MERKSPRQKKLEAEIQDLEEEQEELTGSLDRVKDKLQRRYKDLQEEIYAQRLKKAK